MLAVIVAALVVPVGFALSLSSASKRPDVTLRAAAPIASVAIAAPVLASPKSAERPLFDDVPDAAKLFLVGTMLVGVAMAVRKSA
jgi:hypothetical protein